MKHFLPIIIVIISISSCLKKEYDKPIYSQFKPILIDQAEIHNCFIKGVQASSQITLIQAMGNYLLLLDMGTGIHILDNTNPNKPTKIGFYQIPACIDFEVKGTKIFANNYRDLIIVNFNNILQPTLVNRKNNIFDFNIMPPDGEKVYPALIAQMPANSIIIGYQKI